MNPFLGRWKTALRRAPFAAAFMALALQLMFPAGFMAAAAGQGHGLPIVICTLQGQVTVDWDSLAPGHSKKAPAKPMAACPFAGHATAAAPPARAIVAEPVAFWPVPETVRAHAVAPGRGLAAPPPPAIGPPVQA